MGTYMNVIDIKQIGERVSRLMNENKLTDAKLAEILHVTIQCVNKWRHGRCIPDVQNLVNLSHIFQTSTDYLLTGKEYEHEEDYYDLSA